MIVTCDVVESGVTAKSTLFAGITTLLASSVLAKSALLWGISAMLVDASATARSFVEIQPVATVVEKVVAYDTWSPQSELSMVVRERATARDTIFHSPESSVTETATASSTLFVVRSAVVNEVALAGDVALFSTDMPWLVTERARASDMLFGFNDFIVTENAEASDLVLANFTSSALLVARAEAFDEAMFDSALEDLLVADARASSAMFTQLSSTLVIDEYATALDRALLTMFSQGWVMNTENFGMSRYTGMPIESLAVVGGRVLALGEAGLYELAGDTDAGELIPAAIVSGRSMLGTASKKRIPDVFLTGTFAAEMDLTVGVYGAVKGDYTYTVARRDADSPRGTRVRLGKGLCSTYWKFTIANKNGGDFNINTMTADVAPSTTRRI